jgi:hypothetical protein
MPLIFTTASNCISGACPDVTSMGIKNGERVLMRICKATAITERGTSKFQVLHVLQRQGLNRLRTEHKIRTWQVKRTTKYRR